MSTFELGKKQWSVNVSIVGTCLALAALIVACCQADELGRPFANNQAGEQDIGAETGSTTGRAPVRMSDLNDVQLIFDELSEQVRIAEAKLGQEPLKRKREMGRLQTLVVEADEQIAVVSAKIQRLKERQRQLVQDLEGIGESGGRGERYNALIARYEKPLQTEQARLSALATSRSSLQQKLDSLRREHMAQLLEAAIDEEGQGARPVDALQRVLEKQLTSQQ